MSRLAALVCTTLAFVCVAPQANAAPDFREEVVALTNAERAKVGCGALVRHESLDKAAQGHSADMAEKNYFSHTGQDGSSPFDRIARAGYPKNTGQAENIAAGYATPSEVVVGWMNSAGHKKNMLNCSYKSIGVGYSHNAGAQWRHYWVQTFGTR